MRCVVVVSRLGSLWPTRSWATPSTRIIGPHPFVHAAGRRITSISAPVADVPHCCASTSTAQRSTRGPFTAGRPWPSITD